LAPDHFTVQGYLDFSLGHAMIGID